MHLHSRNKSQGFTIVEVVVVVAIVALLSAVLMFQFRKFDSQLLLRNTAYEVAGALREVQVFGVSVRGSGGYFDAGYGLHFTMGTSYLAFRDTNLSGTYDASDLTLATYAITGNRRISALCVGTDCTKTSLDILFRRPDPDAIFNPGGASAEVRIGSTVGTNIRKVLVSTTGQISIQ